MTYHKGWTKGPWKISKGRNIQGGYYIDGDSFYKFDNLDCINKVCLTTSIYVCDTTKRNKEQEDANAALIAAAPRLFDALEALLSNIPELAAAEGVYGPHKMADINAARATLRAADNQEGEML